MRTHMCTTFVLSVCVWLCICTTGLCTKRAGYRQYTGDIEVKKVNLKVDLRKDSAYDARHTAVFAGRFPSEITKFDSSTSVQLDGTLMTNGSPIGATATKTPTKLNKKGTRMQSWVKKYGASDQKSPCPTPHGNPIMRNVKLWANARKGTINYLINVNAKDKGQNPANWMQYYPLLQQMFGEGKVSDSTQGEFSLSVTGTTASGKRVTETHTIIGPVDFYGRNGRLTVKQEK